MISNRVSFYHLWTFFRSSIVESFLHSSWLEFHYDGFYFLSWIFLCILHPSSMSTIDIFLDKCHLYRLGTFLYFLPHIIHFFILFLDLIPWIHKQLHRLYFLLMSHLIKRWLMVFSSNETRSSSSSIFLFCSINLSSNFVLIFL